MKVIVRKQLKKDMERASRIMGLNEQELAQRALRFYLASIQQEVELESESRAWERISDEALLNMDRAAFS